jgi:hypothetical protein
MKLVAAEGVLLNIAWRRTDRMNLALPDPLSKGG